MENKKTEIWESFTKDDTVRLERSFAFETPESSEYFAEVAGASFVFPNLSVFVEPVYGAPVAKVVIKCRKNDVALATAGLLAEAFNELRGSQVWRREAA